MYVNKAFMTTQTRWTLCRLRVGLGHEMCARCMLADKRQELLPQPPVFVRLKQAAALVHTPTFHNPVECPWEVRTPILHVMKHQE
jgi:hypothetical protein